MEDADEPFSRLPLELLEQVLMTSFVQMLKDGHASLDELCYAEIARPTVTAYCALSACVTVIATVTTYCALAACVTEIATVTAYCALAACVTVIATVTAYCALSAVCREWWFTMNDRPRRKFHQCEIHFAFAWCCRVGLVINALDSQRCRRYGFNPQLCVHEPEVHSVFRSFVVGKMRSNSHFCGLNCKKARCSG